MKYMHTADRNDDSSTLEPVRTDRLVLRPYRPDDAGNLLHYYGLANVSRYLLNEPWTLDDAREAVRARESRRDLADGAIALVVEYEGRVIGDVAAWLVEGTEHTVELGWVFSPEFSGQGFAAEAVTALVNIIVFAEPRVHRVIAQMDARNSGSTRLAQRIGMRQEAHFRQNLRIKNEWTDTMVFATLRSERTQANPLTEAMHLRSQQ